MSLVDRSATQLLADMQAGRTSSVEIVEAFLKEARQHEAKIGAFLRLDSDAALKQAKAIDERRKAGKPLGRLAGLPVAVKDLLCSKGELTTCASRMLENFRAPYDATVVARLKQADAVLFGRTNLD